MNDLIAGLAAEAERPNTALSEPSRWKDKRAEVGELRARQFPVHQFPATSAPFAKNAQDGAPAPDENPDLFQNRGEACPPMQPALSARAAEEFQERAQRLRTYRGRTVAMLRRYMRYSIETGRLPSLLGREFFRTNVTSYTVVTFEDRVIFVHDMESCLGRLDEFSRELIARHVLQEHDMEGTARLLHCNEKTVRRLAPAALDQLSEILLGRGLLERVKVNPENSCQGGENGRIPASDCEDSENKLGEMSG
jgi:hypothetical protein